MAASSCIAFRRMNSKLHIPLMKEITASLNIEDAKLPEKLMRGLPIIGRADESPFFQQYVVPAKMTKMELLQGARKNTEMLERKMAEEARKASPDLLMAVFLKTQKEVENSSMGPPLTKQQVDEKYGRCWNGVQRFGILQGVDSSGNPKYRCIDNHLTALTNDAAERRQKIEMSNVATIMLLIRSLCRALGDQGLNDENWAPMGSTQDLKAAYRQCPLSDTMLGLSITMVWNPVENRIDYHELYGQPFGAGHAVPNFYRIATWACVASRRLLGLLIDHFFDDYWMVEPKCLIQSACWAFKEFMALMGLTLDPGKETFPAAFWQVLGVDIDMSSILATHRLLVKPRLQRIINTVHEMISILRSRKLTSTAAARLFGKLDFANQTLFGRVGRVGMLPIKKRQHSDSDSGVGFELEASLIWMIQVLLFCPDREMSTELHPKRPVLLYTDGSSDMSRSPPHVVGAVVVLPESNKIFYTSCVVPKEVVADWLPSKQYIYLVELFAGPVALDTFPDLLQGRDVIHFVDNNSALGALVKGYSSKEDAIKIVADYWLRAMKLKILAYVDRVESKSNISDDPSRLNEFKTLQLMGASYREPILDSIVRKDSSRPEMWFGGLEIQARYNSDLLNKFLSRDA